MSLFTFPTDPKLSTLTHQERKNLLGGKGAGLLQMTLEGIKVPPFIVLSTEVWAQYIEDPTGTMEQIALDMHEALDFIKAHFDTMPLLSVRSGSRVSCPGMMDTILNVGLTLPQDIAWEQRLGTDCYTDSAKRLVVMYGNVVKGVERHKLECETLPETLAAYQGCTDEPFPSVSGQLLGSIRAVFDSWSNDRAAYYRKMNNIPFSYGTAVTIQAMVFGNRDDNSCTGVMFTRHPDTGENVATGEFLVNAQGEDVVAGIRTPDKLENMQAWNPEVADELLAVASKLETLNKDVQDIEFTVESGKLYILQTRSAKRSSAAAIKIAHDMAQEGVLSAEEALKSLNLSILTTACLPKVDPAFTTAPHATGLPACSGVVYGTVTHTPEKAVALAAKGQKVILVREETTPEDIAGMDAAVGVLTMTGGATSHAAVVARSMNKPCVVGLGSKVEAYPEGSMLTIDGSTGRVWKVQVPIVAGDRAVLDSIHTMMFDGLGVAEIGTKAPSSPRERFVLDITGMLISGPKALASAILETMARVKNLTIYMSDTSLEDPAILSYYKMLFPGGTGDKFVTHTREYLQEALEAAAQHAEKLGSSVRLVMPLKFLSGYSGPFSVGDPIVGASLLTLASIQKGSSNYHMILPPSGATAKEMAAMDRVRGWLAAEGVTVAAFNSPDPGGAASFSVVAKKVLG